jgi:hypothetical protein
VRLKQIRGEAPRAETAIHLEGHAENRVARQVRLRAGRTRWPLAVGQVAAEVVQENLYPSLLRRLSAIVRWPILRVSGSRGYDIQVEFRRCRTALPLLSELRGNGVFTRLLTKLEVLAIAVDRRERDPVGGADGRLRRVPGLSVRACPRSIPPALAQKER